MLKRWNAPNGYRQALDIGLPLVMSMMSSTIMLFTDRIFLGNYSLEALSASVPASATAFFFLSFFMGVVEYVSVFVAQYTGAMKPKKVGQALWQGLWFCVPAGLILASLSLLAGPIFSLGGHPQEIQCLEITYFRILTCGGGPFLIGLCLSCFFSGRGLTKPIMAVSAIAAIVNIPLDYCLINGYGPFPELGIAGAGIATVVGYSLPVFIYGGLVFRKKYDEQYHVMKAWRFDHAFFKRFMRFGLPGGIEFLLDIFAVTFFVFMIGRFGQAELAATNAVFSIYNLAFLPTIGMHIAASIMAGKAMGERNPDQAAYATKSVLHIALVYTGFMAVLFVFMPEYLLELFRTKGETASDFDAVLEVGLMLMRYVAAFTMIDAVVITYTGGLKGAGDTKFIMCTMGIASLTCMVGPLIVIYSSGIRDIHAPWLCLVVYVVVLATVFMWRFRKGPWRKIEVIDHDECVK